MTRPSPFCTCKNTTCPLHPMNHTRGCTPCISKNLRQNELPNCFFNKVPGSEQRTGDSFADFAELVCSTGKQK